MYQVGDLIVYGNTGVCRVEKIGKPDMAGVPEGIDYYTLSPYFYPMRQYKSCDAPSHFKKRSTKTGKRDSVDSAFDHHGRKETRRML